MASNNKRSAEAIEARKLYKTAKWRRLREAHVLDEPCCRYCMRAEEIMPVEVVDHIKPHKGDLTLFYDPDNLQSLCNLCHSKLKQWEENNKLVIHFDGNGWPI